jgi:hypothetical protein
VRYEVVDTLISEIAIVGADTCGAAADAPRFRPYGSFPLAQLNESKTFPIFGSCMKVIELKSRRVVAESWLAYYAPFLARHLTLIPSFSSSEQPMAVDAFWSRALLIVPARRI